MISSWFSSDPHLLQGLLDVLAEPLLVKDRQHRWVLCNEQFSQMIGRSPAELISQSDQDFWSAEQAKRIWHQDEQVFLTGETSETTEQFAGAAGKLCTFSILRTLLPVGDFLVWVMQPQTGQTALKTADQQPNPGCTTPLEQIAHNSPADNLQATAALLRQKEQLLRSIYEGIAHPIFVIDVLDQKTFRYADCNLAGHSGFANADQITTWRTVSDEVQGLVQTERQRLRQCVKTRQAITYEAWLMQNEMTWWQITLNPLWNEAGQVYQIIGTMFNITDGKLAEAKLQQQANDLELALQELQRTQMQMVQSEKMSSLGQLVAGVAHEINNPVNFISGNLNHAKRYVEDLLKLVELYQIHCPDPVLEIEAEAEAIDLEFLAADLPKLLNSMRIGAERIQAIVASLRTFSRMDEADMKAVDIHEGIESTVLILQNRLKPKGSRPEIQIERCYGKLPLIECYAGQLNQVFMNVLSNAIDALEDQFGQSATLVPRITVRTSILADNQICIQISDNGTGMTEAVQQRLFEPFFTTKAVGKGTGMGMSISYQIVTERHGGSFSCASKPGQGSEFTIVVPSRQVAVRT